MKLEAQIGQDLAASVKVRDERKVAALRLLKSGLKNAAIALRQPQLDDSQVVQVLRRELKKRREAAESFRAGQRPELASKEEAEAAILQTYLPVQLTTGQINQFIDAVITEQKLPAPYNFGQLMSAVMKKVAGQADGQAVRELVQKRVK